MKNLMIVFIVLFSGNVFAQTETEVCELKDEYNFFKDFKEEFTFRLPCIWLNDDKSALSDSGKQKLAEQKFSCRNDLTQEDFRDYVYCGMPALTSNAKPTEKFSFQIGALVRYGSKATDGNGCEKDSKYTIQNWGAVSSGKNYELSLDSNVICEL